jgi:hypothetical protein
VHYLDVVHQLGYRYFMGRYPEVLRLEDEEEQSVAHLLDEEDVDEDASSLTLPYTTAGIRLANEDLSLIRRQAQRQFPSLGTDSKWGTFAGQVHRVVICQKMLRGVFDRKRLRAKLVKPLLMQMTEVDRQEAELLAAKHARGGTFDFNLMERGGLEAATGSPVVASTATSDSPAAVAGGPPSTSALSAQSPASGSYQHLRSPSQSVIRGNYSVVAEFRAMKAMRSGTAFNRSSSQLSSSGTPNARGTLNESGGPQHSSGGVTPTSGLPLLMKAVSLPLASTTEAEREDGDDEDTEAAVTEVPMVAAAEPPPVLPPAKAGAEASNQ